MAEQDLLVKNRVILAHFDSYSAALLFARWGNTLLVPAALPEGAAAMTAPAGSDPVHDGEPVTRAVVRMHGLNPEAIIREDDFDAWMQTGDGPVRVHLLRFTTPDAPKQLLETKGGVFKAISELRGIAMTELTLLRQVFNLIVGGSK